MDYSKESLERIKELASKLTTVTEIGALMELPTEQLRDDIATEGSPAHQAFYTGMAETALKIRERDIELADAGSPSAAEAVKEHLKKMLNDL